MPQAHCDLKGEEVGGDIERVDNPSESLQRLGAVMLAAQSCLQWYLKILSLVMCVGGKRGHHLLAFCILDSTYEAGDGT